jgi:four helix bundle protein
MANGTSYRDLLVWKQGMELLEQCYAVTRGFPQFELYGLSGQIRRAAVSIPSNIAEGACRRGSTRAYLNHVSIALGSQGELDTCIEIALKQTYVSGAAGEKLVALVASTGRLLNGLYNALERRLSNDKADRRSQRTSAITSH